MSRCLPFPPPGYETKPRSEHKDLLRKEKHKEKKRKKEKRKKEKRKVKDHRKDRHREKKDKKEKKKDRRKNKDRGKDKNQTSAGGTQKNGNPNNERPLESKQNDEVKDTGLTDELVSQILVQEGQETYKINKSSVSLPQSFEGFGAAGAKEKGRVVSRVVEKSSSIRQHNHGTVQKNGKIAYRDERRKVKGRGSNTAMQNKKIPPVGSAKKHSSARHSGNGVGILQENSLSFKQSNSEGIHTTIISGAGRCPNDRISPIPNALQRTEQMGQQSEISSHSAYGKDEGMDNKAMVEMENTRTNHFVTEHMIHSRMDQQLEQSKDGVIEGKAKNKEEKTNHDKRVKDKDRDQDVKKKKGKDKNIGKQKEKKGDKNEQRHKEFDAPGASINNKMNDPMHLALRNEKRCTSDSVNKRKELEANGSLHEHEMRMTKLPRMSPTEPPWENGGMPQHSHRSAPCSSMKPVSTNISEGDRLLEREECHNNGITGINYLKDLKARVSSSDNNSDKVASKPPRPDSKYLSQVYSVPSMDECTEFVDQDWLFYGDQVQPKRTIFKVAESPQVWAEALLIESADIVALPYVVPL